MSQQSFNNGDQLLDVRTDLNANAAENESRNTTNTGNISTNTGNITTLQNLTSNEVIVVKQASDLSGTLSSTKIYEIDGTIAMGSQTITVPSGGLTLMGRGNNVSGLATSEASFTLFVDASSDAGSITVESLDFQVDGTSSKVFDLDNSGAGGIIRVVNCTFTSCKEIGEFDAFQAALFSNMVWFTCLQGITLHGTWIGGISVDGFVPLALPSGATAFKEGTSLVFGARFISNANMSLVSTATGYNFSQSNFAADADFELINGAFSGAGTQVSGITRGNTKCRWRDNNGLGNTYVGGRWTVALSGDEVINSTSPTSYSKINGTTTPVDLQWFSAGTANDITFDSTQEVEVIIQGVIYFTGSNNQTIQVKLVEDSGTPADILELGEVEFIATASPTAYPILAYATISSAATKIEVHAKSSSGSFTMKVHSILTVTERAN